MSIIDFYKNKNSAPYYTTKFTKEHGQTRGGYIDFATVFVPDGNSVEKCGNKVQSPKKAAERVSMLKNYMKIKELIEQPDLDKVDALRGLDPEFILNPDPEFILNVRTNKRVVKPNQKWHFFVSFCAQHELEGTCPNIFNRSITCPELWLWLIEEAKDNIIINDEDVKEVYETAVKYKTKGNDFGKEKWKAFLDKYREKVKEIIKLRNKDRG